MIWYDMIWYMIWYDMIYDMIWYDIWYDMIWYDMIWYMIWYDMTWYDIKKFTEKPAFFCTLIQVKYMIQSKPGKHPCKFYNQIGSHLFQLLNSRRKGKERKGLFSPPHMYTCFSIFLLSFNYAAILNSFQFLFKSLPHKWAEGYWGKYTNTNWGALYIGYIYCPFWFCC